MKELKIPVTKNKDNTLTCFVCLKPDCDLVFEARSTYPSGNFDGAHLWIGIHERCAKESWNKKSKLLDLTTI